MLLFLNTHLWHSLLVFWHGRSTHFFPCSNGSAKVNLCSGGRPSDREVRWGHLFWRSIWIQIGWNWRTACCLGSCPGLFAAGAFPLCRDTLLKTRSLRDLLSQDSCSGSPGGCCLALNRCIRTQLHEFVSATGAAVSLKIWLPVHWEALTS